MAAETIVSLTAGNLHIELSPSIGGAISAFEWIGAGGPRPILRKCHSPLEKVLDAACFPLVPFVNRIRGGRFDFRGCEIVLAPNMAGDPSPLHGQGWLSAWQVDETRGAHAALSFHHAAGEWPWDYMARQEFALDAGGLSVSLTCANTSHDPMPCGLGLHPYLPCGPQTRLRTEVASVWTIDQHVLPVERIPADGRFDLDAARPAGPGPGSWLRRLEWLRHFRRSRPGESPFPGPPAADMRRPRTRPHRWPQQDLP